jgi:hypothetical protein
MKFVICTINQAKAHGIEIIPTMRQSVNGTQVVLHEEYVRNIDEFSKLKRYEFDDAEFTQLMNSEEWNHGDDYIQPNEDYAKVKAMQILTKETTAAINTMSLSNKESISVKEFYPKWEDFISKSLNDVGFKILYKDNLYEVLQPVPVVIEHQTPDIVPANYGLVSEHDGTKDDPIPYERMMIIRKDKYYTQNGKLYVGILDAPNGYDADLDMLQTLVKEVK